jgi:Anthrax toxin LF subunit
MVLGSEAYALTGIPASHGEVFQATADATRCMISSRAVGKYATGLIEENYASKGFHNKAKSCNWGPMAGFVLADPRFTKAPEINKQAKALRDAHHEGAIEVPVIISEARRLWLLKNNCMKASSRTASTHYYFAASPQGDLMLFVLEATMNVPGANGGLMWSVKYARSEGRVGFTDPSQAEKTKGSGYLPVLAMRDPMCTIPPTDYRAATTGDYDLFAVYAPAANYSPDTLDRRMVSHARLERRINRDSPYTGEDEHLGNMTARIRQIRDSLNTGIVRAGYTGGNMVHHSDEGGRPFVSDVDLPVFAVVPGKRDAYGIESVEDLREFISVTLQGYAPVFNPGWMKQLVFHSDPKKAAAIHSELLNKIKRT